MKHSGRFIEEEKKKKSKKPLIIIIIVILVIAAAGAVLYFNWGNWFGNNPAQDTNSDFVIDSNAGDGSVPTQAPQKAESIQIPGYPSITIAANKDYKNSPATIKISTVALDQKTPLNGANVETVLIAK